MQRDEAPAAPSAPSATAPELPADPAALWSLAIAACTNRRLRVLMDELRLVRLDGDTAVLAASGMMRSAAVSAEKDIRTLLSSAWRREVRVEFGGDAPRSAEGSQPGEPAADAAAPAGPITEHPLVKHAIGLFGARVVSVQARPKRDEGGGS